MLFVFILILLSTAIFLWPKNLGYTEFYFVKLDSFSTYKEASSLALQVQEKGASGYIYFDGKYNVLASTYQTKKQAESVAKNLVQDYKNTDIFTLSTFKEINISSLSKAEKNAVLSFQSSSLNSINSATNLVIQFDKDEISFEVLKIQFKQLFEKVESDYNSFISLTKSDFKKNLSKEYSTNIVNSLNILSTISNENNLSSKLKYELTNIIVNYCCFVESF